MSSFGYRFASLAVIGFFISMGAAVADQNFEFTRHDSYVPPKCTNFRAESFSETAKVIIYGVEGARTKGFHREYPISRNEAAYLWDTLNQKQSHFHTTPRASQQLRLLKTEGRRMGFDFQKEGDVLETLALIDLRREYPLNEYFHTGGVMYYANGRLVGELDVIVGRRSDCQVVAIGEAKLGVDQLGHAKEQMRRFLAYIKRQLHCSPKSKTQQPPSDQVCGLNI